MLKNRNIIFVSVCCLLFGATSCKKYLDVNTNPNVAQSATLATILPAAQLYIGNAQGVDLEVDGSFWVQYWTQSPSASQYTTLDRYSTQQDGFSYPWANLYSGAENFYQLGKLADSLKNKNYKAIALLMRAYTFQLITDGWGDVPYTQALKGAYADGHVVNPKYDSQVVVYNGIISCIDSANKLLATNSGVATPGADDLIYGGNMSNWQAFANTLKLRVLLRMLNRNYTGVTTKLASLMGSTTNFIDASSVASIAYGFNSANQSPLYSEEVGVNKTQNLVASKTCIDSMNNNNDYRLWAFYNSVGGNFIGIKQGDVINNFAVTNVSIPSSTVGGDANNTASANAPVKLISDYESYFLQAEAAARGYGSGNDSALYYKGIYASFNSYGTAIGNNTAPFYGSAISVDTAYSRYINGDWTIPAPAGMWAMYPTSGSLNSKLRYIITQKWFSMCGNQGFEAWCEYRRTGYPDFLITPVYAKSTTHPTRLLYPTSESTVNPNFPGLKDYTVKVWWAL